jgi:heme/copper-type cytochrome/quinol oxidase subunit 2
MATVATVTTLTVVSLLLALAAVGVVFTIPGPQGPQGVQGLPGPAGPKGASGSQGPPGVSYSPAPQERDFYILVLPDMGGDTYDIFLPSTITVNQGDNVSIVVRNTDGMDHGFELDAYHINVTVSAAEDVNGTSVPTETIIPTFVASTPGVFQFFCSIYCGDGHSEMIGYITVLPTSAASSATTTASG